MKNSTRTDSLSLPRLSQGVLAKAKGQPLYIRLAQALRDQIESGVLRPGDRCPSVRESKLQFKVSLSTVIQAYSYLEELGLIEAKPQSGYFVKEWLKPMAPLTLDTPPEIRWAQSHDALLEVVEACGNPNLIPFGAAVIDSDLLPTAAMKRSLGKVLRQSQSNVTGYTNSLGPIEYRRAIAKRSAHHGLQLSPDEIIATTGCMEAIFISLMATTKPGDLVAVESPTYHGIVHALERQHLKVLEVPTDHQNGLDLDALEQLCLKHPIRAVICTPNYNNPIGSLMSDSAKSRLCKMAQKFVFYLIEDDVYGDLSHSLQRNRALKSFDQHDRVFLCSSYSKTLSPGFRAGWLVPPNDLFDEVLKIKYSLTVSSVQATQLAVADYLSGYSYEKHLRRLRPFLSANIHSYSQRILQSFPNGTRISQPKGGFLLWVELPEGTDSLKIHEKALKAGISVTPGPLFSPSGSFNNCIRINCGNPWHEGMAIAIEKLASIAESSKTDPA